MKILIVNGIPVNEKHFEIETAIVNEINNNTTHQIDYFVLRDMNIHYCTGCWDCWVKTPGRCAIKDDQEQILSRFPHADMVLFISPVIAGYESALLKKSKDRLIPAAHPYIKIFKGEQHHRQRYKKSPKLSVLLIEDENTTKEDIDLIKYTYQRIALNFHSDLTGFHAIKDAGGVKNVLNFI